MSYRNRGHVANLQRQPFKAWTSVPVSTSCRWILPLGQLDASTLAHVQLAVARMLISGVLVVGDRDRALAVWGGTPTRLDIDTLPARGWVHTYDWVGSLDRLVTWLHRMCLDRLE